MGRSGLAVARRSGKRAVSDRGQGETGVCVWVCPPRTTWPPSRAPPHPPACSVTIHNRCKDALANCTKVKQKVSWQGRGGQGGQ